MKKTTPLLPWALGALLLSCGLPSFTPKAETLPAVQGPARVMDSSLRLSPAGQLQVFKDGTWQSLAAKGLPTRVVHPDPAPQPRPISAFSQAGKDRLALVTPLELYTSADSGATWSLLLSRNVFGSYAYLTSVAISALDPQVVALGTSFHGLSLSRDGGKTWTNSSKPFDGLAAGAGYFEVINALAWSAAQADILYVSVGINGALFRLDTKTLQAAKIDFPGQKPLSVVDGLLSFTEGSQEILEVRTREGYWRLETGTGTWVNLGPRPDSGLIDPAKAARLEKAAGKNGLYITSSQAANPKLLAGHLDFMAEKGLNALVVDFKEDTGHLAWKSAVPLSQKLGNSRDRLNVPELVKAVHDRGFYLIARCVVFKDEQLYRYANFKYALWDKGKNKPWGYFKEVVNETTQEKTYVQKEFWVDTWSSDVWEYNVALANELEGLGIDEIQFDYIRFPSDGPVGSITSRFQVAGMSKMDALESFLKLARSHINIPVSVDIFGFNGYFTMDYLGQNMELLAQYVDAISPMFYPSHFDRKFLPNVPYMDRAWQIYSDGSNRTWTATRGQVVVRPWVQAFLIGGETKFDTPTYVNYLARQLQGVKDSKANGMLLWNASNRYYMVTKSLSQFQTPDSPKASPAVPSAGSGPAKTGSASVGKTPVGTVQRSTLLRGNVKIGPDGIPQAVAAPNVQVKPVK